MRKSDVSPNRQDILMDAEQTNQIGSTLADLSARTLALRGYL